MGDNPEARQRKGRAETERGITPRKVRKKVYGRLQSRGPEGQERSSKGQGRRATIVSELFTGLQHQLFLQVHGWDPERRFHLRGTLPDHPYRTMGLGVGQPVLLSLPPERVQVLE